MPNSHRFEIQTRFGDTDALGHINHASYATYAETARLVFFRSLGALGPRMVRDSRSSSHGGDSLGMILARLEIDYRRQVSYFDRVHVDTRVAAIGRKSMTLAQQIYANDALAAEVKAVMVAFDYARQETREVPDGLRAELSGYLV